VATEIAAAAALRPYDHLGAAAQRSGPLVERLAHALDLFAGYTAAYLNNGAAKGFLRADLDAKITARLINSMIFEAAANISDAADPKPLRDRLVHAVTTLMFDGVTAR